MTAPPAARVSERLSHQRRDAQTIFNAAMDAVRPNDSYSLLAATGDLLITGPTRTNVMDLQIGLAGLP